MGVLLGYTPLHHLLLQEAGTPLVATSGNASDEPMPIDAAEARQTLSETADAFLLHDRPILRPADDSVVRLIGRHAVPLRVGRGLAPVKVETPTQLLPPLLATGGHLKAAIALSRGREIWLGPHIGDLGTPSVRTRYQQVQKDLLRLFGVEPQALACDLHPDYFTTQLAQASGLPVLSVQHHHAHVASCLAEHGGCDEPVLGIAWDGTGFGTDASIWGGEFLRIEGSSWQRVGSLWPFPLVGGDRAARQPRQSAACVQFAAGLGLPRELFTSAELKILEAALVHSSRLAVTCTSAGRLFDAWASLLGLSQQSAYEGEAAILLEEAAHPAETGHFPIVVVEQPPAPASPLTVPPPIGWNPAPVSCRQLDWRPWVAETQAALARGIPASALAAQFHNSLAAGTLEVARHLGIETVVLTGGCFQNRILSQTVETLLTRDGFRVLTHRRIPAGDGGLAVGQLWAASLSFQESTPHVSGNPR